MVIMLTCNHIGVCLRQCWSVYTPLLTVLPHSFFLFRFQTTRRTDVSNELSYVAVVSAQFPQALEGSYISLFKLLAVFNYQTCLFMDNWKLMTMLETRSGNET